jgi:hypothetical protein
MIDRAVDFMVEVTEYEGIKKVTGCFFADVLDG